MKHDLLGRFTGPGLNNYVVDEITDCWLWQGAIYKDKKYGLARLGNKTGYAHKLMYENMIGVVPNGYELHHVCENPKCINPWHLKIVTHTENMRYRKDYKLTKAKAECLRNLSEYFSVYQLSELFSISVTNTRDTLSRKIWK